MTPPPIKYTVHHISLNVKNMEQSMAFYQRLGFREYYTYSDDNVLIEHLKNR